MQKLKVGIVGCGVVSRRAHIPAWLNEPRVKIKALADVNERALIKAKKLVGEVKTYSNYFELLKEDLDIIDIATPPETHKKIILDSLKEGKHVLVEKPAVLESRTCNLINELAQKKGLVVGVIQNHRYIPAVINAKETIKGGLIGKPVSFNVQLFQAIPGSWAHSLWQFSSEKGGGLLFNTVIHVIDLLIWFFGEVTEVYCLGGKFFEGLDTEMFIEALVKTEKTVGSIESALITGSFYHSMDIRGTAGSINIDLRNNYLRVSHSHVTPLEDFIHSSKKLFQTFYSLVKGKYMGGYLIFHQPLIKDFVSSVIERSEPPVSILEAKKSLKAIEAMFASLTKGEPVKLKDET